MAAATAARAAGCCWAAAAAALLLLAAAAALRVLLAGRPRAGRRGLAALLFGWPAGPVWSVWPPLLAESERQPLVLRREITQTQLNHS